MPGRRRVLLDSDDDDPPNESNDAECDEERPLTSKPHVDADAEHSPTPRTRYALRVRSAPRLEAVDSVLAKLKQQREGRGRRQLHWTTTDDQQEDDHEDSDDYEVAEPRPRKRARGSHPPEPDSDSFVVTDDQDDDGWLVADDAIVGNDALSHIQLDNTRALNDEDSPPALVRASIADSDAFPAWCKFLCTTLIDADFSAFLDTHPSVQAEVLPVLKVIEERFEMKKHQWVKSQLWEQSARQPFLAALQSLPYCESMPIREVDSVWMESGALHRESRLCDACSGQHHATHRLKLFGVRYHRAHLTRPFDVSRIFDADRDYSEAQFAVGELCHKRARLFHAMTHFKLHCMLSLRVALEQLHCRTGDVQRNTKTITELFAAIDRQQLDVESSRARTSADYAVNAVFGLIQHQFQIFRTLHSLADLYSATDTRAVKFDVSYFDTITAFEREACALTLFDLRGHQERTRGHHQPLPQSQLPSGRQRPGEPSEVEHTGDKGVDPDDTQLSDIHTQPRTSPVSATPNPLTVKTCLRLLSALSEPDCAALCASLPPDTRTRLLRLLKGDREDHRSRDGEWTGENPSGDAERGHCHLGS